MLFVDNFKSSLDNDQIKKLVSIDGMFLVSMSIYSIKLWDLKKLALRYRFNNNEAGTDFFNYDISYYKLI